MNFVPTVAYHFYLNSQAKAHFIAILDHPSLSGDSHCVLLVNVINITTYKCFALNQPSCLSAVDVHTLGEDCLLRQLRAGRQMEELTSAATLILFHI